MSTIIQTNQLSKSYGRNRGIIEVTFAIQEGEVFGFLGPNGAGKTTTMRVLMGLLHANSGSAMISGLDCWTQSTEVKKLVGYLPGEFAFDPGLRGAQIIEYLGHLRGGVDQVYMRSLVERLGLDPSKRFREYSHGSDISPRLKPGASSLTRRGSCFNGCCLPGFRPNRSYAPSAGRHRESLGQHVLGGVFIPFMLHAAVGTDPLPHIQRERFQDLSARRARLGGRKEAINLDESPPVPVGFVLQLAHELSPSHIADGFGKAVVLDHAFDVQTLHTDHLVFVDNPCGQLMLIVSSLVSNAGVKTSHLEAGFRSVLASLAFLRQPPLCLRQFLLVFAEELRVAVGLPVAFHHHAFDAQVQADHPGDDSKRLDFLFDQKGDEIAPAPIFAHGDRTGLCSLWQGAVKDDGKRMTHLRQCEGFAVPAEGIGGVGRGLFVVFLLEDGIVGPPFKEVLVGRIEMTKGLLKRNGRDLGQEGILLLESGKQSGQDVVGELLPSLFVGGLARQKAPVVDEAHTAEGLSQLLLLLNCRVEPVLVGALCLLAHDLLSLSLFLNVLSQGRQNFAIQRAIILFGDGSDLFQQGSRKANRQGLYLFFHVAILTLTWLHVKRASLPPLPQTRNAPHIPVTEVRGFTAQFNKQKLGLVQAFMHKPRLLILDEPTSGLDPLNQQEFYKMVAEVHAEGRTVFLSSHILPEIEHTCERVGIIREGRLVKIDHVPSLKDIHQHDVEISFPGPSSVEWFNHVAGVTSVTQGADERTLQLNVLGPLTEIIHIASDHHATNIATREPTLEEVFLRFYEPEQEPSALAG
jgi:ABC-type multidrug transport system ATPase subunit